MTVPELPVAPEGAIAMGSRALFEELQVPVYLNHAAISPPSSLAAEAIRRAASDYSTHGLSAFMAWLSQKDRLRQTLASLFGASPDDVALTAGTTRGVIDLAFCIPWEPGQTVICFEGEFPANVIPWQMAARTFDLDVTLLPLDGFGDGSGDGLARLEAALSASDVRVVAVSAVQFQTGLRMPLQEMADLAHAHGAELFVDAIQSCGVCPIDVAVEGIDYLVSGAHKWMMGVEGCGFAVIAPDAMDRLVPRMAGWLSVEDSVDFLMEGSGHLRYDKDVRNEANFLEGGAYNTLGFAALEAGVEPIRQLGVGAIYDHVQDYHDAVEPRLLELGFTSARAADPGARSGILSLAPPDDVDVIALSKALAERGVSCATPDGYLRMAPHWPNGLDEVEVVLEAVEEAVSPRA